MPYSKALAIDFAVSDVQLTGSAGLALVATSACWLDLHWPLARRVPDSRRLGESLARMSALPLARPQACEYTDQDCGQRWMRRGSGCRCRRTRSSW